MTKKTQLDLFTYFGKRILTKYLPVAAFYSPLFEVGEGI